MKKTIYLIMAIIFGLSTCLFFIKGFTPIGMLIGFFKDSTGTITGTLISILLSMGKSIILCIINFTLAYIFFNLSTKQSEKGQ